MSVYTLSNLQQIYEGRKVLDLPDLEIEEGEILGIVGPSGAGKSTLLRLLGLLEAPTQGHLNIRLNGHHITYHSATLADRRQMATVFQRPLLLSRRVRGNVGYGLKLRGDRNWEKQVDHALDRVALRHLAEAKPHTLSGGEMQRVAVARALVLSPSILLLDEPTANLDPHNIKVIEDFLMEEYHRYRPTIIIVTHNIFQAKRLATRMILIMDGQIIESAPTDQFFSNPQSPITKAFITGDLIY